MFFFFEVPQNFLGTKIVRFFFVCSENPDFCSLFFFLGRKRDFLFSKEANAHGASVVSIKEACDNLSLLLKTYLEPH